MELLDILLGAALVSAVVSGYFLLQRQSMIFGLAMLSAGLVWGIYIAEYASKSDRTSFGEESQ